MGFLNGIAVALFFLAIWIGVAIAAIRSDAAQDPWDKHWAYIEETCSAYDICPELVQAIIERESNWDEEAVNGRCVGLMQIDPTWQKERMDRLGVTDLTDPEENILVGVDFLSELFQKYEDVYAVLMFFNAGYSDKYGLGAYERGEYSDYAEGIITRAMILEMEHGK